MSSPTLPADHDARMQRARLALDGTSVGDAFGANILLPNQPELLGKLRSLPQAPWQYTDDTIMAMGIVEVLQRLGRIDQDELASVFARRYWADVNRGYGPNILRIFDDIKRGVPWRVAATTPVGDRSLGLIARMSCWLGLRPPISPDRHKGSLGNGGAMRVAPVGGYYADNVAAVIAQANASAEVTHAHPDGKAGAVAVALAAAWAWRCNVGLQHHTFAGLLDHVLEHTPGGPTYARLVRARELPVESTADEAARELGNGCPITSAETVPFTIWCAGRHLNDFEEAVWTAASVGGDIDTICAIVAGIVILACGLDSIPTEWLKSREPLDLYEIFGCQKTAAFHRHLVVRNKRGTM